MDDGKKKGGGEGGMLATNVLGGRARGLQALFGERRDNVRPIRIAGPIGGKRERKRGGGGKKKVVVRRCLPSTPDGP